MLGRWDDRRDDIKGGNIILDDVLPTSNDVLPVSDEHSNILSKLIEGGAVEGRWRAK